MSDSSNDPNSCREAEFVTLVQAHQHQVTSYIYALVHNLHDTEDIYQQTLEILWSKFDEFDRGGHFGRWACGVARLEVANFRRRQAGRRAIQSPELMEQLIDPATQPGDEGFGAFHEALAACKKKLPDADQRLLGLYYGGEFSARQIAQQLHRTLPGIYNALSRIRQALLRCIELHLAREADP